MAGIRRAQVLGLVLIVGTAIEQAPSPGVIIKSIRAEFLQPDDRHGI